MSSGLWAPVGPPLNLGLMEYVHIQTMVPLSVYSSTQWWGKVVAGIICSVHLFHLHQPLQAPRTSLHPFCRLHAICQAVFWGPLLCTTDGTFQLISFLAPDQYDDVCSPRLVLSSARRWTDISHMNGTTLHFYALPVGPLPIHPSGVSVWNAGCSQHGKRSHSRNEVITS